MTHHNFLILETLNFLGIGTKWVKGTGFHERVSTSMQFKQA
jgi:hypothetical protein